MYSCEIPIRFFNLKYQGEDTSHKCNKSGCGHGLFDGYNWTFSHLGVRSETDGKMSWKNHPGMSNVSSLGFILSFIHSFCVNLADNYKMVVTCATAGMSNLDFDNSSVGKKIPTNRSLVCVECGALCCPLSVSAAAVAGASKQEMFSTLQGLGAQRASHRKWIIWKPEQRHCGRTGMLSWVLMHFSKQIFFVFASI